MQGQSPARTRKLSLSVAEHTTALLKKQVETGRGSRVVNRSNNNANTNGGVAYVVLIRMSDGEERKFFTNNEKMKKALDFAREKEMIPFDTTIKADGGYGYMFT